MHQAVNVQFGRIVREFAQWRAVPKDERSPAPAWWWGSAFEVRDVQQAMPADWCAQLELPADSSHATGAEKFLDSLAGQASLPWPDDFPRRARYSDPA